MEVNAILNDNAAKVSFLMGLVFLAKADGTVAESEKVFFQNAAYALELDEKGLQEVESCWAMDTCPPLVFSTLLQKKFFLREAMQLCCVDGSYGDEEKALVRTFADSLGVSRANLEVMEQWVLEGIAWQQRGNDLLTAEDK